MSFTAIDMLNAQMYAEQRGRVLRLNLFYEKLPHLASHLRYRIRRADRTYDYYYPVGFEANAIMVDVEVTQPLCHLMSCNSITPSDTCKPTDEPQVHRIGTTQFETACQAACFNLQSTVAYDDSDAAVVQGPHLHWNERERTCQYAPSTMLPLDYPLYRSDTRYEQRVNDLPLGFDRVPNDFSIFDRAYIPNGPYCEAFFDIWDEARGVCRASTGDAVLGAVFGSSLLRYVKEGVRRISNGKHEYTTLPSNMPPVPAPDPLLSRSAWLSNVNTSYVDPSRFVQIPDANVYLNERGELVPWTAAEQSWLANLRKNDYGYRTNELRRNQAASQAASLAERVHRNNGHPLTRSEAVQQHISPDRRVAAEERLAAAAKAKASASSLSASAAAAPKTTMSTNQMETISMVDGTETSWSAQHKIAGLEPPSPSPSPSPATSSATTTTTTDKDTSHDPSILRIGHIRHGMRDTANNRSMAAKVRERTRQGVFAANQTLGEVITNTFIDMQMQHELLTMLATGFLLDQVFALTIRLLKKAVEQCAIHTIRFVTMMPVPSFASRVLAASLRVHVNMAVRSTLSMSVSAIARNLVGLLSKLASFANVVMYVVMALDIILTFWDPAGFNNQYNQETITGMMTAAETAFRSELGRNDPTVSFDELMYFSITEEEATSMAVEQFLFVYEYLNSLTVNSEGTRIDRGEELPTSPNDTGRETVDQFEAANKLYTLQDVHEYEFDHAQRMEWFRGGSPVAVGLVVTGLVLLITDFALFGVLLIIIGLALVFTLYLNAASYNMGRHWNDTLEQLRFVGR